METQHLGQKLYNFFQSQHSCSASDHTSVARMLPQCDVKRAGSPPSPLVARLHLSSPYDYCIFQFQDPSGSSVARLQPASLYSLRTSDIVTRLLLQALALG